MRHIKLEEPPRTRLRVHHIAKEIGVSSQVVLEVLEEIGEYVKSSQSLVEAPIIRRVHERFGVTYASPARAAESFEAPTSSSGPHNPEGLAAPPRRPKRDNHPLMGRSALDVSVRHTSTQVQQRQRLRRRRGRIAETINGGATSRAGTPPPPSSSRNGNCAASRTSSVTSGSPPVSGPGKHDGRRSCATVDCHRPISMSTFMAGLSSSGSNAARAPRQWRGCSPRCGT